VDYYGGISEAIVMNPEEIESAQARREDKQKFAVKIGHHLRKIRESKHISQENLSLQAGYYRTYVGKIEQGKYSPSLHTIWRISHALNLTLEEFFREF